MIEHIIALLISISILVAGTVVIIVITSDSEPPDHLVGDDLDVKLIRTSLEYSYLLPDGTTTVVNNNDSLDLSNPSKENVFGIDSPDIRIVPGSYFTTGIVIESYEDTTVSYSISIITSDEPTALHSQLLVTLTDSQGKVTTAWLSELTDGSPLATGEISDSDGSESFKVSVELVESDMNNSAQGKTAVFDLVVSVVAE